MDNSIKIDDKVFELYLHQTEIEARIREMALEIRKKYEGASPVFIVVLNGAFMFAGEFFKTYNSQCEVEFVKLMSYIGAESSGDVINCIGVTDEKIRNKPVVILEDIIDSGLTMDYFMDYLQTMSPSSVEVATLLFKPSNLKKDINLNYYGFSIPPLFVVGYGLDYNDKGRNLTNIYQIVNP